MAKRLTIQIVKIRKAIANYMYSEGCDCCEGSSHDSEKDILAKMENRSKRRELMSQLIEKGITDGTITQEDAQMLLHKRR